MVITSRKRNRENDTSTHTHNDLRNVDRFSELPNNVIEYILDRVPLFDAVRTSVLAKKWRKQWTRMSNLVFDQTFRDEIMNRNMRRNNPRTEMAPDILKLNTDFIGAVNSVLLLHNAPIHKFVLHVPEFIAGAYSGPMMNRNLYKWINVVSRKGVKEININADETSCQTLSSCIFDCEELRHLALHNCKLSLPHEFRGFENLNSLELHRVVVNEDKLSLLISRCPLLEHLVIDSYVGTLSVSAPLLRTLREWNSCLKNVSSLNVPNLVSLYLANRRANSSQRQPYDDEVGKYRGRLHKYDVVSVFCQNSKLADITLCVETLIAMRKHQVLILPKPLECLRNLTLLYLDMTHVTQLNETCVAICILRSAPFLSTLNIRLSTPQSPLYLANEKDKAAEPKLEELLNEPELYLSNLKTVKINGLRGTRCQNVFLKFILTRCPALEVLYANAKENIFRETEHKMMSMLMDCERASSKARVKYSKNKHGNIVSYSEGKVERSIFDY